MATKRFAKSAIDWAAFAERVPPGEKIKFQSFKAKVDGYTKKLMSYPEKPPAIDFALYRARLPNPAMADEFEKQFKAVKVPFPVDKLTPLIDEQEKKIDGDLKIMKEISELNCKYYLKRNDVFQNGAAVWCACYISNCSLTLQISHVQALKNKNKSKRPEVDDSKTDPCLEMKPYCYVANDTIFGIWKIHMLYWNNEQDSILQ
ncbi:ATP synthase subunit d, mitochondrial [Caerostris extrusa]|uniref:ATP synthase subunit d, mitochondrial n=1 Tax=Caerostris extrusa TaxID=172846 RepID=A0AAV4XAT7_CAEEX|nr:ATP synthase subunit d, mitochondrial [Caerostris extrusa]